MLEMIRLSLGTLGEHVGDAGWALAVFACGFVFAFPVVRFEVSSLLAFPMWVMRIIRGHLKPETNPVGLFAFIFVFNSVAMFCYMMSGGLVFLPLVFGFLTGLNLGVISVKDTQRSVEKAAAGDGPPAPPRPWVGLLGLFVIVVELSAFWLAIGMGIRLGHIMRADFSWTQFIEAAVPRARAYLVVLVPALAASAAAEAAAIKGAMGRSPRSEEPSDSDTDEPRE